MKKISSSATFYHKRLFPLAWFGFLTLFVLVAVVSDVKEKLPFLLAPVVMAVFGYAFMKKTIWDLADEVYDCGEYLIVKFRDDEENVPLTNIINVGGSGFGNPARITILLAQPGKFGAEISFAPSAPFSLNPFARSVVANDLTIRVDRARRNRVV